MIKKILSLFLLIVLGLSLTKAQSVCTPDAACNMLVCPDTATNLPHADANVLYETTMTVKIPTDTSMSGNSIHVDSLIFNSVSGLPFDFTAVPDQEKWNGGSSGCIIITGTAADSMKGKTYPITITTTVYGKLYGSFPMTLPVPLEGYKIIINGSNSVNDIISKKFIVAQNVPNPFTKTTKIKFISPANETYHFSVFNVVGEMLYSKNVNAIAGENFIEVSAADLYSGIYIYKLSNGKETITKRMIVEGE